MGQSRSASIVLVYLAREKIIKNISFEEAQKEFIKLYPNYSPGEGIKSYLFKYWDELMSDSFLN